jgi:phage replication-related protein YjqB (UPF0714/DUF867 family)
MMPRDRYQRFCDLEAAEQIGVDYRICVVSRNSAVAIIAPHGGTIEAGTSEIAAAIANDDFSLYCFEGLRRCPHSHLHISSTRFDEPQCRAVVASCDRVVAVHGLSGTASRIDVGGRDHALRDRVCAGLAAAGFDARVVRSGWHAAVSRSNVCNMSRRGAGVQLEITKGLRESLTLNQRRLMTFAGIVRAAILAEIGQQGPRSEE